MDIDLLAKMIKKLILDSDKVVLPGVGCFVAEVVPATFSDRGYTINPPYRKLYFRSKPDEGDELVTFYAENNNLPFDVAENVLKDFLSEMKTVLFIKKTVVFPGLGRLRATKENDIFFVADEGLDIYPNGFGLEPISLKSHQETPEEVSAVVSELKSIIEEPAQDVEPMKVDEPVENDDPVKNEEPEAESQEEQVPDSESPEESISPQEPEPAESIQELAEQPVSVSVPEPLPVKAPVQASVSRAKCNSKMEACCKRVKENLYKAWAWLMDPKRRVATLIIGGVIVAVAAFFIIFIALANIFPGWMDSMLYSAEELEIINKLYE